MRTAIFVFGAATAGLVGASDIGIDLDREFGLFLRAAAPGQNLQTFTGNLGGATADPITNTGTGDKPFSIPSGETFTKLSDAVQQSCANQFNTCQKTANAPGGGGGGGGDNKSGAVTVQACTDQQNQCKSAVNSSAGSNAGAASSTTAQSSTTTATTSSLGILKSQDANFFYFCDS